MQILAINPGSTSTKIGLFENDKQLLHKTIRHSAYDLEGFKTIAEQYSFRKNLILEYLQNEQSELSRIEAVIGRGGLVKPIESGIYRVNDALLKDLRDPELGEHASNLGGIIAHDLASSIAGAEAFIADPVVVDELEPIARISGHPLFERISIFHALNQKAVARTYAQSIGKTYESLRLVIAHLGGGISVGAHQQGRVIDVNQALDGEGPFSPERSGTLPINQLIDACFSGQYSKDKIRQMVVGGGGLVAYLGTNDSREVQKRIGEGDEIARLIYEAMAYQVSKAIGGQATVLKGKLDAILLTGGIAHDSLFTGWLTERVGFMAPVRIYPGEDELAALAGNAYLALTQKISIHDYQ